MKKGLLIPAKRIKKEVKHLGRSKSGCEKQIVVDINLTATLVNLLLSFGYA